MEQNKNNQNTALLVMDVQEATVKMLEDSTPVINAIKEVIQTTRDNKIQVIYVVVGFRKGFPEVSPHNKSFSSMRNGTMNLDTEDAIKVHASVAPQPGDIIITKKRVSAFT